MSSSVVSTTSSYHVHGLQTIRPSIFSRRSSHHRLSPTVDLASCTIASRHFFGASPTLKNGSRDAKMDRMKVNDHSQPPSDGSDPGAWKVWAAGIFFTVIIPFWQNKWGPLKKWQERVEEVVDAAQEVVEVVEDAAEGLEKLADELGDKLPQGSKLQKAASMIENLANQTTKNTDRLEEALDKVEELENKVEEFLEEQMEEAKEKKNDEKKKTVYDKKAKMTKPGSPPN